MRLIAIIALPPLLVFAVLLAIMQLPLPRPFPRAGSDVRELMALVLAPILFIAYLYVVVANTLTAFDRPARFLDGEMAPFGLTGRRHGVFGRSYQGEPQGFAVRIEFQPAAGLRSHLLNVHVAAAADRRAAISSSRPILDCRDCPEIRFTEPGMVGLRVFADDETWIRTVLGRSAVQTALAGLIQGDEWSGVNELYIQPERIWLRAHPRLVEGDVAVWMPMLLTLARAVDAGARSQDQGLSPC